MDHHQWCFQRCHEERMKIGGHVLGIESGQQRHDVVSQTEAKEERARAGYGSGHRMIDMHGGG
jgi:hypothetical protein